MRKPFTHTLKQFLAALFVAAILSTTFVAATADEKMKLEDVLAKHRASIGTAEALAAAKSRVIVGNTEARLKLTNTPVEISGPVQFASDGEKVLLAMIFNSTNYAYEKAGYDGKDLTVGVLQSGRRSILSDFFFSHESIFKQGLIGGALSSAWPLLNSDPKSLKLSYSGTKKINNRQAHELKVRSMGDMQVSIFLDGETFRHIRTEYQFTIPARMGPRPTSSVQDRPADTGLASRFKMVEEFSDFKTENNLTLPHTYKLSLTVDNQQRTQMLEWNMGFSQYIFNQPLDAAQFSLK